MPEYASEFLWILATFSGLGAAVDFLIGPNKRTKVRDFMETWWIKFDDVDWKDLGQREVEFAVSIIDRWCGRSLFTLRRFLFVTIFCFAASACSVIVVVLHLLHERCCSGSDLNSSLLERFGSLLQLFGTLFFPYPGGHFSPFPSPQERNSYLFGELALAVLGLTLSISLTRQIAKLAGMAGSGPLNFLALAAILVSHYFVLGIWIPVLEAANWTIVCIVDNFGKWETDYFTGEWKRVGLYDSIISGWFSYGALGDISPAAHTWLDNLSGHPGKIFERMMQAFTVYDGYTDFGNEFRIFQAAMAYFCNLGRIIVAMAFILSFLIRNTMPAPISLVWRRIVESDKPVFTLILGGIGSLAAIANEIIKHM